MKPPRQSTIEQTPTRGTNRFLSWQRQRRPRPSSIHHITIYTEHRRARFSDLWTGREVIRIMKAMHDYDILHSHAFVLMPDHLHWLISIKRDDAQSIVQQLKLMSTRAMARRFGRTEPLWQQGFVDVAVRDRDCLTRIARHVVASPLRAALVQRLNDYPHWDAEWMGQ